LTGPDDYESALQFIQKKFLDLNKSQKDVQSYVVCTLDTEEVKPVLLSVMQHFKLNLYYSFMEDDGNNPPIPSEILLTSKKASLVDLLKNLFSKKTKC
jgi:hypothetical protein